MIRISDVKGVSGSRGVGKKASAVVNDAKNTSDFAKEAKTPKDTAGEAHLHDLLEAAVAIGATTIHIEPHQQGLSVRYRVDGMLRDGKTIPTGALADVTARIKSLANLDVAEDRVPQDGRFTTTVSSHDYTVRATVLPVADGEKIVLHLAGQGQMPHDLEKLGYWGHSLQALNTALEPGHGMVVVTGPAGSGKTATMYGLLHMVADPTRSIATVEDVVEHRVPGITQAPVNTKAGMTFFDTLQAVLRQDPNVVMVSELQEPATARLAIHTAIDGHLVVAGLHFRNVAAALAHLAAMDIEPYLLATAVRAVANQRLARRLCPDCRQAYAPTTQEFTAACHASGLSPQGVLTFLQKLEPQAATALNVPAQDNIKEGAITTLWRARPDGCTTCGHTGYKGRIALCEVITVSPAIQKLIFATSPAVAVYNQAINEGLVPLPVDGFVKALLGQTSLDEVLRVVAE